MDSIALCVGSGCLGGSYGITAYEYEVQEETFILPADERASALLNDLLTTLNFKIIVTRRKFIVWQIKSSAGDTLELAPGITLLNKENKCIMSEKSQGLPQADYLFARIIALSSEWRNKITTLSKEDLNVLERLLPIKETQAKITQFLIRRNSDEIIQQVQQKTLGTDSDSDSIK